ncbi:MAG TPA: protease pro-enzyme activation domain-containing protein [Acidimicrobiales bacterium]|nr:protease pro-enzyme activation domain-containing protein [Acidimicrobiales bacterium]
MVATVVAGAAAGASGGVPAPPAWAGGPVSAVVVKVAGGPERLPPGTRAVSALPGTERLSVDVALSPADPAALEAFDQAVSTPGSPSFRRFVTPGEFAARFGPGAAAVAAVRSWLRGEGLTLGATARDDLLVPVSGSAARLATAFGVGFEEDRLPGGRLVREPTAPPEVPGALAGAVEGVVGLDDLAVPVSQIARPVSAPGGRASSPRGAAGIEPHTGPTPCGAAEAAGTTATDLAQAYSMASLYGAPQNDEGQGVTVGIYELEPYQPSDIAAFEACYSPSPSPTITGVSVDGTPPNSGPGSGESALDIEMVVGLAPQANIDVYVGRNFGVGPLDVLAAMVNQDAAQVLSTSWGECEPLSGTAQIASESNLLQEAAAQGQTFTAAAGDAGSEDCNVPGLSEDPSLEVDDPASQPWATGVGGTQLGALGPPPAETVWNTGTFEGTGGGGISTRWTMPSWQLGPGVESAFTRADDPYTGAPACPFSAGAGTVSCREVPDVTADADPATGYATFCSCGPGGWQLVGGTSMGAPLWASVAALADASVPSPPGRIGLLNPALYQAGCLGTPPFNDVRSGDDQPAGSPPSDPPRTPGGPYYPATSGYDMASGLGSPVASALVPDLVTPVSACPVVSGLSTRSGPAGGGTAVVVSGANLGAVTEVDFGPGNPGAVLAVSGSSVTVRTPASPTGGWDTAEVVVRTADDALGFDGRNYFTYVGPRGYWTVASDGGVFTFGHVGYYRSLGGVDLARPVVGMAATPSSRGYWLVASDGGIFAFGHAVFAGSMGGHRLVAPMVGVGGS